MMRTLKLQKTIAFLACFLCVLLFMAPARLHAQVSMQIKVVQKNFLQYESVFLRIAIRNMSAHPLAFGESGSLKGKLWFEIFPSDTREHKVVQLLPGAKAPDLTGLILAPGTNRTFLFNLTNHYDVRKIGKYAVRAVISHPQLSNAYQSNEDYFNILRGSLVWERTVGVPLLDESLIPAKDDPKDEKKDDKAAATAAAAKSDRKIDTRKYRILKYNTGTQSVYVLSIEDKNNVYLLRHIGFDLGAELKPKCEVDFLSRLNVLIAASTKVFAYYLYNTDGEIEKKQILMKTTSEPFLATDIESGMVHVVGGREARKDIDYEEIRDLQFLEDMSDTEYFPEGATKDENDDIRYQGLEDKEKDIELTEDDIDSFGESVVGKTKTSGKTAPSDIKSLTTDKKEATKPATNPATAQKSEPAKTVSGTTETKSKRMTTYENSEVDSAFEGLQ